MFGPMRAQLHPPGPVVPTVTANWEEESVEVEEEEEGSELQIFRDPHLKGGYIHFVHVISSFVASNS